MPHRRARNRAIVSWALVTAGYTLLACGYCVFNSRSYNSWTRIDLTQDGTSLVPVGTFAPSDGSSPPVFRVSFSTDYRLCSPGAVGLLPTTPNSTSARPRSIYSKSTINVAPTNNAASVTLPPSLDEWFYDWAAASPDPDIRQLGQTHSKSAVRIGYSTLLHVALRQLSWFAPLAGLWCFGRYYAWSQRHKLTGRCCHCGYDRTGLRPNSACPECGSNART